jgi:hypothetical protein
MKVIRETAVAGKTIYRSLKTPSGVHTGKRQKRSNATKDAVAKNNERLSVRRLMLMLNANFDETCSHVTLTYSNREPGPEEAAKDRKTFIRKIRSAMKKAGKELKYVVVTEYLNKRIHHHLVINVQDSGIINKLWGKGHVHITPLDDNGEYSALAEYLIKETRKTFRLPDSPHKCRYSASRNLVMPVIKRELVSPREMSADPEPLPGYYIPKDSIRRYEHPVTELEHLEYVMIALDSPRKYKTWPRGKTTSGREYYKAIGEEQIALGL